MSNFGQRRTISIPWWTLKEDGHKSKMPRNCTIDYKIEAISKFVRWEQRRGLHTSPEGENLHGLLYPMHCFEPQRAAS